MSTKAWHRRQAIQIAAALPEDSSDALIVLELAKELVETYLCPPQREAAPLDLDRGNVVSLSSTTNGVNR